MNSRIASLLLAGLVSGAAFAENRHLKRSVMTGSGLACESHLWLPQSPTSLVVFSYGTGVFSVAETMNPVAKALLKQNSAILSIDKPGIAYGNGTFTVDWKIFARHRPQDLLECTAKALDWASRKAPGPIVLSGHSAGAETAVDLVSLLTAKQDPILSRVAQLMLYGPPLDAWSEIVGDQVEQMPSARRQAMEAAFENRDAAFFLQPENGSIPLGYLDDLLATTPLSNRLKRLAAVFAKEIWVFQGMADKRCKGESARLLEADLAATHPDRVRFKYYASGHDYDPLAVTEMTEVIEQTLRK